MIARRTPRRMLAGVVATVVVTTAVLTMTLTASSCAREKAAPAATEKQLEFGALRVQVAVPAGWDALDQGEKKRFRRGEAEIVLQDPTITRPWTSRRGIDSTTRGRNVCSSCGWTTI